MPSRCLALGDLLVFRRDEHSAEVSAPPGDRVNAESADLVVLDAVRAHVVENGNPTRTLAALASLVALSS
jgi:hypothetical protein